jgi:TPR repeat protein
MRGLISGAMMMALSLGTAQAKESVCPTPAAKDAEAAEAAFSKAQVAIEASRDGEHYRTEPLAKAVAQLRLAAAGGALGAQYRLGQVVFSTRFQTQGPVPAEKGAYVDALSWIAVAARRGHVSAESFLSPEVMKSLLDPNAKWAPDPEDALSSLPEAWVRAAATQGAAWAACWKPALCPATADAASWAPCAGQRVRVEGKRGGAALPKGEAAGLKQTPLEVGAARVVLLSDRPLICESAIRASGPLRRTASGAWTLRVEGLACP